MHRTSSENSCARAKHLLLNPVFDEMEHMELLASDVIPKL
jgi:hypothetical protein